MAALARSVLVVAAVLAATPSALATCIEEDDGTSVCCSPDGRCSDDKPDSRFDLPLGAHLQGVAARDARYDSIAAMLSIGIRYRAAFDGETLNGDSADATRLCAPLFCGFAFIGDIPKSALLGNEIGLDLRVGAAAPLNDEGNRRLRATLAPVFRGTSQSSFRTASLVGALVPSISLDVDPEGPEWLSVLWTPYPAEVLVADSLIFSLRPQLGSVVPLPGGRAAFAYGLAISATLSPNGWSPRFDDD